MREVNLIVIHCADTYSSMDIGVKEIRQWHKKRGFTDIGYHFVIRRDGTVEKGRDVKNVGAHAQGFNYNSIGICYAGGLSESGKPEDNRTQAQKDSMQDLVKELVIQFPKVKTILGHRDLKGVSKACPCFDVIPEFKDLVL